MTDPLGLIGNNGPLPPVPRAGSAGRTAEGGGPGFKELLKDQIEEVNQLQNDATRAAEDVVAGRRDDLEGVIIAIEKADTAFRMLLQVRNKMMDAYEEVKQIRI
jgi:flagellar hook-basal body complex protein FliE